MFSRRSFLWLVALAWLSACSSTPPVPADPNVRVRAAFDVGSGSTKVKVARVDLKAGRVIEALKLSEDSIKVAYKDALGKSTDKRLGDEIVSEGVAALKKLKAEAEKVGATEFTGVATAAFRQAANGQAAVERIAMEAGIDLKMISQDEEAILGFRGAAAVAGVDPERLVVWDIGGGSQQIVARNGGEYLIFKSDLGSDTLKQWILEEVKRTPNAATPNPLGKKAAEAGLRRVRNEMKGIPKVMRARLRAADVTVVGIGGVHEKSVRDQVRGTVGTAFTREQVMKALKERESWTDERIGGNFAPNQVVNLILVGGAGIGKVIPLAVNLGDGLLLGTDRR